MEPITATVVGTTAGFSLMKKTLSNLQSSASDGLKKKLKKLNNMNKQREISRRIRKIGMVKTLFDSRIEVDLSSIYHPTNIQFNDKIINVSHVGKLPNSYGVLVEGTVGQGKSTFMRFLVCSMARVDSRIPIFLELRNIRKGEGLVDALKRQLDVYGFESDDELFEFYCASGKFVFFLDGFDELKFEDVQGVVVELSDLRRKYNDTLRIIVSSRPGGGLSDDPLFKVVRILPILGKDRLEFLMRIDHDKERSERLALALNESSSEIVKVLKTPLMLTLLCKIHSAYNQIPESFIEFYEKLFMAMYRDHDDRKPGFTRRVRSGLNPNQVEEVFSLFCFLCSVEEEFSFSESAYYKFMSKASEKIGCNANIDGLMGDVVDISCMIIKEGGDYSFIHKSICEYYAAKYVCGKNEEFKKNFYNHMLGKFGHWEQQLKYLMEIDSASFYEYFYIPNMKSTEQFKENLIEKGVTSGIRDLISNLFLGFDAAEGIRRIDYKDDVQYLHTFERHLNLTFIIMTSIVDAVEDLSIDLASLEEIPVPVKGISVEEWNEYTYVDGRCLSNIDGLVDIVENEARVAFNALDESLGKARSILAAERVQNDMLIDLF